ncbi:MAG TPA: LCP family protein [Actinomycetes bacterium]|nr:LCP family protein [Actinomycetes bacterium]
MSSDAPTPPPRGSRRKTPSRHPLLRRTALVVTVVVAVLLVGGGIAGFLIYRHLDGNIGVIDAFQPDIVGSDRPTKVQPSQTPTEPLNILVMGSDTRVGQGGGFGSSAVLSGARSDTTLLIHLPADRKTALVVSIPRDTVVEIPDCKTDTGTYPAHTERFNAAFSIGGPGCTIKTVEQLTDVFIDHFVVVDFRGFEGMVDALGGVDVCLSEPAFDVKSGLDLPAGISTVRGDQALAFVRARYTLGNGSDISRIDRQQAFMSSVVEKARSAGTLLNPIKLVRFLDAATKSVATDPDLASLNELRKLAEQVRGIPPKNITFVTTPWVVNPSDPNTVVWDTSRTDVLWEAIRTDASYPPPKPEPNVIDGKPIKVAPADIQLRVLNGTRVTGAATAAAAEFSAQGYSVVGVDTAESKNFVSTVVRYDPAYGTAAARTVTASLGGATRVKVPGLGSVVEVVVGKDWPGVSAVVVKTPRDPSDGIRTADENICS